VLDVWFEKRFAKSCRGKACLVRYADDFVACFHREEDVTERSNTATEERLRSGHAVGGMSIL
jgi:hypothetical protein